MAITEFRHAVGIFPSRQEAEHALRELRDAGFNMDKVSVVARDAGRDDRMGGAEVSKSPGEQAAGGAAAGASAGAVTGGIMGLIGGLGVLAIPGVGPIAEVGVVLANTLLGSGLGAAGGGLVGALIGWGIPEERAQYYGDRVEQGDYVVLVEGTENEIRSAEAVLNRRGIRDWEVYGPPAATATNRMI